MAEQLNIFIALKQVRQFVSDAQKAAKAMGLVGKESKEAGEKAKIGWKGVALWAGGAAAIYGAQRFLRGAAEATESLAKQTLSLQRMTDLDTQTASEWIGVLHERNISTRTFQVGLKTLSKQMETASTGTAAQTAKIAALRAEIDRVNASGGKNAPRAIARLSGAINSATARGDKARGALAALGVSMEDVRKGNTSEVLLQIADGLAKTENPAKRTAYATALLGRSAITLLPLLLKGREGIEEQLGVMQKYGNYLSGKNAKDTMKLIERQREVEAAMAGAKIQIGLALLPVIYVFTRALVKLADVMQPVTHRAWLLWAVIGALSVGLLVLKIRTIQAAVAQEEVTIATQVYTAAVWLLNAALDANPIVLVVGALILLGVAFYVAYKKVGWFHKAIDALWQAIIVGAKWVWNFFKNNWPYIAGFLGGPFVLAGVVIAKHWRKIVDVIKGAINVLIRAWNRLKFHLPKVDTHIPGVGTVGGQTIGVKQIPQLAEGGIITRRGSVIIGEKGPEVMTLPEAARVQPLSRDARPLEIRIPLIVDGRELARAVARVSSDRLARR